MSRGVRWVTDPRFPVNVKMKRTTRIFARRREGGFTLVKSIYHADVMIASSNWKVSKALKQRVYMEARARAEIAAGVLRKHKDTGNSRITVKRGVSDTIVRLEDPLKRDEEGRQIGGAAFAVEGQTQALGTAFDTEFVRKLGGWKEMFGNEPS